MTARITVMCTNLKLFLRYIVKEKSQYQTIYIECCHFWGEKIIIYIDMYQKMYEYLQETNSGCLYARDGTARRQG